MENKHDIVVVYVDDEPQRVLSRYLHSLQDSEDFNFFEFRYTKENVYSIIEKEEISKADIIIMDDKLYKETSLTSRLTGSGLKALINLVFPYKKIIIISQYKPIAEDSDYVEKYHYQSGRDESDDAIWKYYDRCLRPVLKKKLTDIRATYQVLSNLRRSKDVDKLIVDDATANLYGQKRTYTKLTSENIDSLVNAVNKLIKESK